MATKRSLDGDDVSPNKRTRTELDGPVVPVGQSQQQKEEAVGITVFVSPEVAGFECVVKHRYTDFLVNEILPSGEVLHLTDLSDARKAARQAQHSDSRNGSKVEDRAVEQAAVPVEAEPEVKTEVDVKVEVQVGAEGGVKLEPGVKTEADVKVETSVNEPSDDQKPDGPDLATEDRTTLLDIFGEDVTKKIVELYHAVLRNPQKKPRDHNTIASGVISEKSKRTEAHVAVRRIFDNKLQSETLQDQPGVIAVKASPPVGVSGPRGQHGPSRNGAPPKGKVGWQELGGEYLHFTLHKENKDTMEVLSYIAAQLKIPAKNFEFAGTKDRRGVTVQRVAVFRIRAERIADLNRSARGWRAGGFEYKKHGMGLGDLVGNEFLLTLRDLHVPAEEGLDAKQRLDLVKKIISQAGDSFKTNGFLNYYGLQRFGSFSTGTHVTGLKMLQGDLEGAVNSILTYSTALLPENVSDEAANTTPRDDIARADIIRKWREGTVGPAEIREAMPRRFSAESAIMQYLSKKDKRSGNLVQQEDWQGALNQIQRNLRLMYVHAYQSLVWNRVAGKRWELYGGKAVEGDLVIVNDKDTCDSAVKREEVDQDGEMIVKPAAEDSLAAEDTFTRARPLSKDEAESGKYSIFDVVLPQPGFDVLYPTNEIGKYYKEFMSSEEGGGLDPHNMRRSWKDASLSGSYRKMMARPLSGSLECRVTQYDDADEQLVETDLEKLQKADHGGRVHHSFNGNGATSAESSNGSKGTANGEREGSKIAAVLKFQLASSQYATMALRELCKGGARAYKPEFNTAR
ncbi:multisubstrate pseudouridine synthase 7 [Elasticomyces elasticus]|nr:multisubstrate pseudouridine synthase 7 [Elasticomyces elasticus]KAK4973753.1 multisubstrate pseudouridine synthase 7 [Elasticomyces elasticus]